MADAVVFLGPTLPVADARLFLDAAYHPPAQQGDVHRVLARPGGPPRAIGLIDGAWDTVPTVWHVELLTALGRGVRCYGAASLGALRAAELAPCGMVGVGRIAGAYQAGALEDDDEVAVTHAHAEDGYRAGSVALVDIRATVAAAVRAGTVSPAAGARLVRAARARYYPDRTWPPGLPRVEQKRADARRMLARMAADLAGDAPWRAPFSYAPTDHWLAAWRRDTGEEAA